MALGALLIVGAPPSRALSAPRSNSAYLSQADRPARNTVIELNAAPGAKRYQVQVRASGQIWANPYTFDVGDEDKRFLLKIRLSPGDYTLRTRSIDEQGFYGLWSGWKNFEIKYQPPGSIYPADYAKIKPKSGIREALMFEWPIAAGAKRYRFVLRNAKGEVLQDRLVSDTWLLQSVEISSDYTWAIIPLAKGQTPPVEIAETEFHHFHMQGPAPGTRDMRIAAKEMPRAVKYRFEFLKLDRKGERGSASIFESPTEDLKLSLAPGAYEVRVQTFFDDDSVSDWSPPFPFYVPYRQVKALTPVPDMVFDPDDDIASGVSFSWVEQDDVSFYEVFIYDDQGHFVRRQSTKEAKLKMGLPHDMRYRWLVVPYAAGQTELKPPEMPDNSPAFTIGHYIPLNLGVAEEPAQVYAWGRYWLSMADFEGLNYDLNAQTSQRLYEGSGELAIGYWHRKTRLGVLAHGALSGFWLTGKPNHSYNYTDAGLDIGYRHVMDNGGRLRMWVGPAMREAPEILRNPSTYDFDFHRVRSYGPQIQVSYSRDLKSKPSYGWNTYFILYHPVHGVVPNGLRFIPQNSFTIGVSATYKQDTRRKWMGGYSYREENLRYKSSDRSGNDNVSSLTGHYLTITYEYGLADPYK